MSQASPKAYSNHSHLQGLLTNSRVDLKNRIFQSTVLFVLVPVFGPCPGQLPHILPSRTHTPTTAEHLPYPSSKKSLLLYIPGLNKVTDLLVGLLSAGRFQRLFLGPDKLARSQLWGLT